MTSTPVVDDAPRPVSGPRVVVVGSTNADLVTTVDVHPAPGETVLGTSMTVLPGGKGANQAVAAARLGSSTAFVGAIGTDSFADTALSGLRDAEVDLSGLRLVDGATGVAQVTVSADGENAIVVVPGVNATVDASVVGSCRALVAGAAVVVVQGEIPASGIEEAARSTTGRLVVNLAPVIEVDRSVLLAADPLVVNEHEAALVLAALNTDPVPDTEEEVAAALLAAGVPSVVVTLGSRGAYVGAAGTLTHIPAAKVRAVDTTGAGDAFVGALAHRLAVGAELIDAARFASRVGAFAVRSTGAQSSYPRSHDTLPEVAP